MNGANINPRREGFPFLISPFIQNKGHNNTPDVLPTRCGQGIKRRDTATAFTLVIVNT